MDKLPKVFANPIDHEINNGQKTFISSSFDRSISDDNIITIQDIDKILNSNRHIYKSKVKITTSSGVKDVILVSRNNLDLITIDNEKIPIKGIKKIELID